MFNLVLVDPGFYFYCDGMLELILYEQILSIITSFSIGNWMHQKRLPMSEIGQRELMEGKVILLSDKDFMRCERFYRNTVYKQRDGGNSTLLSAHSWKYQILYHMI